MFNLFGIEIHLYGLLIGIGIWLGFEIALKGKKNAEKITMEKIFPWIVLGGIIGARAYHVIDFWQRYYSLNPIKIFFLWEGGLGIWGAIVGGILASYLYCRFNKNDFLSLLDDLIVGVPLAQAIGRLGNFVNGELYGKNGEPLFAYEALPNLILFGMLWKISRKKNRSGFSLGIYLVGYGSIRILLEGLRPDEIIWKIGGIPIAIIFGMMALVTGLVIIFRKRS